MRYTTRKNMTIKKDGKVFLIRSYDTLADYRAERDNFPLRANVLSYVSETGQTFFQSPTNDL